MLSSQDPESPDRPVVPSSHDQDKPATTEQPAIPRHGGWHGVSDPLPRSVIADDDHERIAWHVRQAHHRALRAWATDPRGDAWVPEELINVKMSDEGHGLFEQAQVVIGVHLPAFLLNAELDPGAFHVVPDGTTTAEVFLPDATWLVECVDGPVAGAMHTIPWPDDENLPPSVMLKTDPAGGPQLTYYLRDTDLINGIARYTSMQAIKNARIYEVTVRPDPNLWTGGEKQ